MPELNKANRQVCDVDIRILKTMAPYLFFDTANTTTAGLSSDNVYAMAKGSRKIAFQNPIEGTMSIEAQVYPFKFFALLSDGSVESNAAYAVHTAIKCTTAGKLPLAVATGNTIVAGTVFVYPSGSFGDETAQIAGTFASGEFTATETTDIAVNTEYEVGFVVSRTAGVKKISFNSKKLPKDYYITMRTLNKEEDDTLVPYLMTAYKASIQRSFDLSFSSEGDPATVTLNFDLLEDKDGNVMDMVEITEDLEVNPS